MFPVSVSRCPCLKRVVTAAVVVRFGGVCEGLLYYLVCWTRSPALSLGLVFPKIRLGFALKPTGFCVRKSVSACIVLHILYCMCELSLTFIGSTLPVFIVVNTDG